MDKNELIISALKQRISEIVSQYEIDRAVLRAEYTSLFDIDKEKDATIEEYSKLLEEFGNLKEKLDATTNDYEIIIKNMRNEINLLNDKLESEKKKNAAVQKIAKNKQ